MKHLSQRSRRIATSIAVCVVGLTLMVLITACAGGSGSTTTVTGAITSVDAIHHTATLKVGGQSITIEGLTDQQVAALKGQVGKTYTIEVTQNSDGTYAIVAGSSLTEEETACVNEPSAHETQPPGVNEPGNISFIGKVQHVRNNSIMVSLPDGSDLSMAIVKGQTTLEGFNGALPSEGQLIKVKTTANADGRFTATELIPTTSDDLQQQTSAQFQGVTTSAVGCDNIIHLRIGNHDFRFTLSSSADQELNGHAQSIGSNEPVGVNAQYQVNTWYALTVKDPIL